MSRILITGSRDWDDLAEIEVCLTKALYDLGNEDDTILVSGACPTGADWMCQQFWSTLRLPLELYPADWQQYGKRAGFIRNAKMVELGADICIAFIKNESKGATMTADLAEKKGIKTIRVIRNG